MNDNTHTITPGLGYSGPGPMRPFCWLGERRIVPPENWSGHDTATAWLEGFAAGVKRSAAPELLAALVWLVDDLTDADEDRNTETGEVFDSVAKARAAIAKAKGVTP